jgi:hypothetical protein
LCGNKSDINNEDVIYTFTARPEFRRLTGKAYSYQWVAYKKMNQILIIEGKKLNLLQIQWDAGGSQECSHNCLQSVKPMHEHMSSDGKWITHSS